MSFGKSRIRRGFQFIDNDVQGKLVFRCAVHWIVFTVATATLGLLVQVCMDPFAGLAANLQTFWKVFGPTVLVLTCLTPVFIYDFIKFSHRFVGPVIKARTVLNDLANGNCPDRVAFREEDFYGEIASDLNTIIEEVRNARLERDGRQSQAANPKKQDLVEVVDSQ